jgi:5'(3')-deoxyribonucleotidase
MKNNILKLCIKFFVLFKLCFLTYAEIKVVAVGDFMPGSTCPKPILLPDEKLEEICENIKSFIPEADIKILNLEGVLTKSTEPFIINQLKYTAEKGKIAEFIINEKKICVVGFSFIRPDKFYSILDIDKAKNVISELKEKYDIIIVSLHGGEEGCERTYNKMEEFLGEKRGNLVAFSHAVIDAGADLVIGHGPHVPRAIELYKNKLIVYSLGNFFTYARFNLTGARAYAPMIYIVLNDNGNFKEGKIIPFIQTGLGIPVFDN